jgi:Ca2+-binding EF-hand superfamily protein
MDIYKALDLNKDGYLSLEEIKVGYCDHMGKVMSTARLNTYFTQADANQDGKLDWNEFVVAQVDHDKLTTRENLKKLFDRYDTT